ncbi:MAG: anti-sigma factor domain-containing protein [Thermoanaerobacter sp.]|uniref:anti-sigma factor domain-containing protein n=1 Tax=Thermoanaerobacter sp. TaxID=1755 RepID=UPI0034643397
MKAVVVQKEKNKTYVMTEKGEFKCLKNLQNVDIGETIELNENFVAFKPIAKILIVASILLALIFTIINFKSAEVYAYVYIDINPSIEVLIDKNGKIISANPINEDGKKILKNLSYKGLDITTFINQTVEESQKLGFLKEDDAVIITTVPIKNSPIINEQIQKAINNIKKINTNVQIETLKSNETQREEAKKEKVSPGRLIIWQKAKEEGIEIPKDKLNNSESFKELQQAYTKKIKEKEIEMKNFNPPNKEDEKNYDNKNKSSNSSEIKNKSNNEKIKGENSDNFSDFNQQKEDESENSSKKESTTKVESPYCNSKNADKEIKDGYNENQN